MAAPINYGYRSQQRSGGGFHLSGTTSLRGSTLIALARDIVFSLIRQGARKIVLMNGHYENYQFVFEGAQLALEDARKEGRATRGYSFCRTGTSWTTHHSEAVSRRLHRLGPRARRRHGDVAHAAVLPRPGGHGPVDDPLYEGLPAELPNYDVLPIVADYTPPSGCLSSPGASSREKGVVLRDVAVATWWTPSAPSSPKGTALDALDRIRPSRAKRFGKAGFLTRRFASSWASRTICFRQRSRNSALARPTRRHASLGTITRSNRGIVMSTTTAPTKAKVPFKVALSSFLGNFIEWFDYATYTYFAITIGVVFFPESEVNSTLLSFAVFALSFIFRPLGASFWGSMGDKKGRKWSCPYPSS